jgi:hypothetical protein
MCNNSMQLTGDLLIEENANRVKNNMLHSDKEQREILCLLRARSVHAKWHKNHKFYYLAF